MADTHITMAALAAAAQGDIDNFIVASTPGGIQSQEKRGQQALVNSSMLPIDLNHTTTWAELLAIGFIQEEQIDDLFYRVTLPAGWTKQATNHDMWSNLLDDHGRVRATIFYKAAFYDRSAHMSFLRRFSANLTSIVPDDYQGLQSGIVRDNSTDPSTVIFETSGRAEYRDWIAKDVLEKEVVAWLSEHYPAYDNPLLYW